MISKIFFRARFIPLSAFLVFCTTGFMSHLLVLSNEPSISIRTIHKLSMGFSYDIMNATLLTMALLVVSWLLPKRLEKGVYSLFIMIFSIFIWIDYQYVTQFGTHLPFSAIEYLDEAAQFQSNIHEMITNWLIPTFIIIPQLLFFIIIRFGNGSDEENRLVPNLKIFFLLILLGSMTGVYPNSYVSKNLNDPLTSSPLLYFYWSRNIENATEIEKPLAEIALTSTTLSGKRPQDKKFKELPMVRTVQSHSCEKKTMNGKLAKSLCGKQRPNILIILVESFRAVDIDSYGSQLKLTPHFEKWRQQGIFFKNFFANGFQTRHGEVAVYCSVMPNYGVPIMKRYNKNSFNCLPNQLKRLGYATSWLYSSDAAFDNQITFFPKIGFDKILDSFSFDSGTEKLGWGYSDEALFKKWIEYLDKEREPFFSSVLTVTNHHPFDVPEKYRIFNSKDDTKKYYEAMYYTDAMLNKFLENIQSKPWYKNTLIFITADTANYQKPQRPYKDYEAFIRTRTQAPLLILGGAVNNQVEETRYFSQIDIAPTIMDILGVKYTSSWFGHSMMDQHSPKIAFTNRPGNYWGVMSEFGRYYNESDKIDHYFGFDGNDSLEKSYRQLGLSWLKTTKWLLQENLLWIENEQK